MLSLSTRFFSLLVVLLALSAVELELSQQSSSNLVSAAPIQIKNPNSRSISSATSPEHHRRGRTTKPRVGIVVKPGTKVQLNGASVQGRSFEREAQVGARTIPLTKIRANVQGKEPLMVSVALD